MTFLQRYWTKKSQNLPLKAIIIDNLSKDPIFRIMSKKMIEKLSYLF